MYIIPLLIANVCLSTEVGETAGVKLHRGLRQPSLLLALLGVVRDNHTGSAAQRAAGSALVAFCDVRESVDGHAAAIGSSDPALSTQDGGFVYQL